MGWQSGELIEPVPSAANKGEFSHLCDGGEASKNPFGFFSSIEPAHSLQLERPGGAGFEIESFLDLFFVTLKIINKAKEVYLFRNSETLIGAEGGAHFGVP